MWTSFFFLPSIFCSNLFRRCFLRGELIQLWTSPIPVLTRLRQSLLRTFPCLKDSGDKTCKPLNSPSGSYLESGYCHSDHLPDPGGVWPEDMSRDPDSILTNLSTLQQLEPLPLDLHYCVDGPAHIKCLIFRNNLTSVKL